MNAILWYYVTWNEVDDDLDPPVSVETARFRYIEEAEACAEYASAQWEEASIYASHEPDLDLGDAIDAGDEPIQTWVEGDRSDAVIE